MRAALNAADRKTVLMGIGIDAAGALLVFIGYYVFGDLPGTTGEFVAGLTVVTGLTALLCSTLILVVPALLPAK